MPRFFLHISNGLGFMEDPEGIDVPDLATAREKAVEGLRDLMAGEMKEGQLNEASFIEIVDEAGDLQTIISFEDAVNVTHDEVQEPKRSRG